MGYLIFITCILLTLNLFTSSIGQAPDRIRSSNDPRLPSAINQMAFDLFGLLKTEYQNILFSPVCISSVMSMLMLGSGGKTKTELMESLRFSSSFQTSTGVHQAFRRVMGLERQSQVEHKGKYKLEVANRIVVNKKENVQRQYAQLIKQYYGADIVKADFERDPAITEKINQWVSEKTEGKIQNLIAQLNPASQMVLLNAIYFKGNWRKQFQPSSNRRGIFYGQGSKKKAIFLSSLSHYPYFRSEEKKFKLAEIPYEGPFGFYVILPDPDQPIQELEAKLTLQDLEFGISQLKEQKIILEVPKFTLTEGYDLKALLTELGIREVFTGNADLSGISGDHHLMASEGVHKATIEVNEEGTIATAAGGLKIVAKIGGPDPINFVADRPFLFFIRNKANGLIYFMGKIGRL